MDKDSKQAASSLVGRLADALNRVESCSIIYRLLKRRGLLDLAPGSPRGQIDVLVDRYVLAWFVCAAVAYILSFVDVPFPRTNLLLAVVVVIISFLRIVELVSFHLNMLVAKGRRLKGRVDTVASFERTFVLLLINYFEVSLWFATWYSIAVREDAFQSAPSPLPLTIFRESLAMMLVNTSGLFVPKNGFLLWAAFCFQSLVGIFLSLAVLARALSTLPPLKEDPTTM